jgi:hypothetical protein
VAFDVPRDARHGSIAATRPGRMKAGPDGERPLSIKATRDIAGACCIATGCSRNESITRSFDPDLPPQPQREVLGYD